MALRRARTTAGAHAETGPGHAAVRAWWQRPWAIVVGALAVAVGTTGVVVAIATAADEPVVAAAPAPRPTPADTPAPAHTPAPVLAPASSPSAPEADARTVLEAVGEGLPIYASAGDTSAARSLSAWTFHGQPLTLLSMGAVDLGGETWHQVTLPEKPSGQTAWVRESDVSVTATTAEVRIFLDERELELWVDGELELTAPTVIGTGSTPTPTGEFYVTDMLDLQANPTGIYGAYAIGLSVFSPTLTAFNGGPPQIAIHGTDATALLGERASNGCVAIDNDKVLALAAAVGRGTPVTVFASRESA